MSAGCQQPIPGGPRQILTFICVSQDVLICELDFCWVNLACLTLCPVLTDTRKGLTDVPEEMRQRLESANDDDGSIDTEVIQTSVHETAEAAKGVLVPLQMSMRGLAGSCPPDFCALLS